MEGITTTTLHHRRSDELNSSLPPTPTTSPSSQHKAVSPVSPIPDSNNSNSLPLSPPIPRRPVTRQQSITRGTASSMAKAVRPNHVVNSTTNTNSEGGNIPQRKLSVRIRKQSLTNMDANRLLVTGSADNMSLLSRRRSSWSPFTPGNNNDRKTPSPSQLSPDTIKKQQEEQQQSLDHSTNISPSPLLAKKAIVKGDTVIKDIKVSTSPTTMTMSNSTSTSVSTRVHSSCSKKTSTVTKPDIFKFDDNASPHAASLDNNQQIQKNNKIPLETPPPDDDEYDEEEKVLNIRLVSGPDQQPAVAHHHHLHRLHHNHSSGSDDDLPGYMRRPICAACNRNVKINSSTESLTHPKSLKSNNSRRSSISVSSTTAATKIITNSHMTKSLSPTSEDNIKMTPTISIADDAATPIKTAFHNSRSHSPTSPIPTTQIIGERKKSILHDIPFQTTQLIEESHSEESYSEESLSDESHSEEEEQDVMTHHRHPSNCSSSSSSSNSSSSNESTHVIDENKWTQLLNQQKKLLEFINKDSTKTVMTLSPTSALINNNNQIDETDILKTQMELLKRFEEVLMVSSLSIPTPITTITTTTQTVKAPMEESIVDNRLLPMTSWQTKVEYSIAKFKWNMSQWLGTLVGTGNIEEKDFDTLGYTKNVVISGVCVTTEPGLLPKNLQKYYRLHQDNTVICHKYLIHLTRENRLSTFATSKVWDQDDKVHRCSFSVRGETHTKYCNIEFGAFHRRHHCRRCGHIFCQAHSSNCLPLFVDNGEERGEWSRVCDSCFYARIEPQFITRS